MKRLGHLALARAGSRRAVWLLHKYAGLKIWHGVICILFGFYLATSSLAPEIRTTVTAIIRALTGGMTGTSAPRR